MDFVGGYELVLIPAGQAVFGWEPPAQHRDEPGADDEASSSLWRRFEAELPAYYLGRYCVTNDQFAAFLNSIAWSDHGGPELPGIDALWPDHPHNPLVLIDADSRLLWEDGEYRVREGYGNHPVVQVSWFGALAFCERLGLRLPTELEWERAARGDQGLLYPWGDEWDGECCRWAGSRGEERTCPVDAYPEGVSPHGLWNTVGNVWEWCADTYAADAYARHAAGDLQPNWGEGRPVIRGGAWDVTDPDVLRAITRGRASPGFRGLDFDTQGFRCARSV